MLLSVAYVASALMLAVSGKRDDFYPSANQEHGQCAEGSAPQSSLHLHRKRDLVIVSTLDGRVTALDAVLGVEQWSLNAGSGPLLSSSITRLEVSRGDKRVHLVPSLDGSLFQFDGDGIEAVPLGADLLLSSSFRLSDESTVVGGKEIETYGIDFNSGKVRYVCSAGGCRYFNGRTNEASAQGSDDILIVKRSTKTVRAVELQTGIEKWNFSVGQHELSYVTNAFQTYDLVREQATDGTASASKIETKENLSGPDHSVSQIEDEKGYSRSTKEIADEICDQCDVQTEDVEDFEEGFGSSSSLHVDAADIDVKVMVTTGHVVAVGHNNPAVVHWQRKFSPAVAAAWILRNRKLSELNLFEDRDILALEDGNTERVDRGLPESAVGPLLYIGSFNDQIYVQPLASVTEHLNNPSSTAISKGPIDMPHIRWRPYIVTAPSRTPSASVPKKRLQLTGESNALSTAVVQWHEQYPFDEGFFLFPDITPVACTELVSSNETVKVSEPKANLSWFSWWTVIMTSVALSVVLNMLMVKCFLDKYSHSVNVPTESQPSSAESCEPQQRFAEKEINEQKPVSIAEINRHPEYMSRYLTDFVQEACLGRGGFGVVFRARNQLDDCVYAVKRIALHDSVRAREKVTREVKALAKLEHPGIVRYYQSWFENPPPGWQEERDKLLCDSSVTTPTSGLSPVDMTSSVGKTRSKAPVENGQVDRIKFVNPLKPFDLLDSDDMSMSLHGDCSSISRRTNASSVSGSSENSLPNSNSNCCELSPTSDSGAESDSFDISFRDSSNGSSSSSSLVSFVPTLNHHNGSQFKSNSGAPADKTEDAEACSIDIVFEDSAKDENRHEMNETARQNFHKETPNRRPNALEIGRKETDQVAASTTVSKLYLYIQMQLCQSQNLKDWLNSNTLNRDKRQLLDIFHQICSAINYVHNNGMMHRDLKPSNIFFAMDGSIKIGDFGLVTAVEENCTNETTADNSPAYSGGRLHTDQVGTKLYMSPEQQCQARNYTHKVDIYALGMIFFELFYPFATEMERVTTLSDVRHLKFPTRFLRELADEAQFVRPLLSHEPEKRPSTKEILQHPIVRDFEEASQAYQRLHSQSRYRTSSNSSGNSTSEGSSPNVAA